MVKALLRIKSKRIDRLEASLEKLEEDYNALCSQIDSETSLVNRKRLQRELTETEEEMDKVAQKCDQLRVEINELSLKDTDFNLQEFSSEINRDISSLLELINPLETQILQSLRKAYLLSRPLGWPRTESQSLKSILEDLRLMPIDNEGYMPIGYFIYFLLDDPEVPEVLKQELISWAQSYIKNLHDYEKKISNKMNLQKTNDLRGIGNVQKPKDLSSSLMIRVRENPENKELYFVEAWFIGDIKNYDPVKGVGYKELSKEDFKQEDFSIDQLPELFKSYLDQVRQEFHGDLTLEVFLPLELLSKEIDTWETQRYGISMSLGCECKVVVRMDERLAANYHGNLYQWSMKWDKAIELFSQPANLKLVSADCDLKQLLIELSKPDVVGIKLAKVYQEQDRKAILGALLLTSTPIAFWLRREPDEKEDQAKAERALECSLEQLPESVKKARLAALSGDKETSIGYHLSLLWDNPNYLPPGIPYLNRQIGKNHD